jgi:hypothetical protein
VAGSSDHGDACPRSTLRIEALRYAPNCPLGGKSTTSDTSCQSKASHYATCPDLSESPFGGKSTRRDSTRCLFPRQCEMSRFPASHASAPLPGGESTTRLTSTRHVSGQDSAPLRGSQPDIGPSRRNSRWVISTTQCFPRPHVARHYDPRQRPLARGVKEQGDATHHLSLHGLASHSLSRRGIFVGASERPDVQPCATMPVMTGQSRANRAPSQEGQSTLHPAAIHGTQFHERTGCFSDPVRRDRGGVISTS